eukprot:16451663-Heterocapsa_arctica.AAC.1
MEWDSFHNDPERGSWDRCNNSPEVSHVRNRELPGEEPAGTSSSRAPSWELQLRLRPAILREVVVL